MIFLNKNVDPKTKGIAGGIGIAVLIGAVLLGIDYSPSSVEANTEDQIEQEVANEGQVDEYSAIVGEITGGDAVYWTPQGSVYHLCEDVQRIEPESQDAENNVIKSGTVAAAHADGKVGLTKEVTGRSRRAASRFRPTSTRSRPEVDDLRSNAEPAA